MGLGVTVGGKKVLERVSSLCSRHSGLLSHEVSRRSWRQFWGMGPIWGWGRCQMLVGMKGS